MTEDVRLHDLWLVAYLALSGFEPREIQFEDSERVMFVFDRGAQIVSHIHGYNLGEALCDPKAFARYVHRTRSTIGEEKRKRGVGREPAWK